MKKLKDNILLVFIFIHLIFMMNYSEKSSVFLKYDYVNFEHFPKFPLYTIIEQVINRRVL